MVSPRRLRSGLAMHPSARILLSGLLLTAVAQAQGGANVLIVIADDMGVDQVGAYAEGANPPRTPQIDTLAQRGVLFRNGWAYPTCSPARAALMTGRHGSRTGIGSPGRANLSSDEITLPEILDAEGSGYGHAWIGKWHLGGGRTGPNDAGWSHFAGLTGGGVTDYYDWSRVVNGQTGTSTSYTSTQMVDDAIAWIGGQSGPWCCVLAFNAPHTPFHAPPANLHSQTLTGNPAANPVPHYKAAIEAMDTEFGRVLAALGPELANTNVVFLGDNGTPRQATEAPFVPTQSKGTPFEGGVRVPFVVAGPAVASGGREVHAVVSIVDLFETTLELAGVGDRTSFVRRDSVSLLPYLGDPTAAPVRDTIYAESFNNLLDPSMDGFACSRDETYKLIRRFAANGSATEELYHLQNDPFEQNDLFTGGLTSPEQSARDRLAESMDAVRDRQGRFVTFGIGSCLGSQGVPTISASGSPRIGQSYVVQLGSSTPNGLAALTVGASAEQFEGVALPFALQPLGSGAGCFLHNSIEGQVPIALDASGAASFPITLPNEPLLLAASVFHSWLVADPGAPQNPLGVVSTNGLEVFVGR